MAQNIVQAAFDALKEQDVGGDLETSDTCWTTAFRFLEAYENFCGKDLEHLEKEWPHDQALRAGRDDVESHFNKLDNSITSVAIQGHGFVVIRIEGKYTLLHSWAGLWTMPWFLSKEGTYNYDGDFHSESGTSWPGKYEQLQSPMKEMKDILSLKFYDFDKFWDEVFKSFGEVMKVIQAGYDESKHKPGFHTILNMATVPFDVSSFK